jgi:nucleoside-diphosphate-sugar epimerase
MGESGKVVIVGAAGATGKAIGHALVAAGHEVVVVGRTLSRLEAAFPTRSANGGGFQHRIADAETAEGARAACHGAETAVVALGLPYHEFGRYPGLMKTLVDGALAEGVRRILLIGNVYPYGLPRVDAGGLVTEAHAREPVAFKGKMRKAQEDVLVEAARAGQVEALVLRLPDFMGPEAELSYAKSIVDTALDNKTANLFAPIDTPHQFVHVPDVGPVVARLMTTPAAWVSGPEAAPWLHFAGSGLITVEAFAKLVYAEVGARYRARKVGRTMLRILGVFDKIMREFVEMQYLQSDPVNLDDQRLVGLIGEPQRTPYAESVRAMVAWAKALKAR